MVRYFKRKFEKNIDNSFWLFVCDQMGINPEDVVTGEEENEDGMIGLAVYTIDGKRITSVLVDKKDALEIEKKWNISDTDYIRGKDNGKYYIGFKKWDLSYFKELDELASMVFEANRKDEKIN